MLVPFPFDGDGVRAVVTTRHGGVSAAPYDSLNLGVHVGDDPDAVAENRRRVADALGVERLTIADQQHGSGVAVVTAENAATVFPATDGLVTNVPGVALATLVADCGPVLLWDPVHHAIGAAHCGRRGVLAGVLAATVAALGEQYGSLPEDLVAGVGPCIGVASYEVGEAEAEPFDTSLTRRSRPGHAYVDLPGAVRRQLGDLGIGTVHAMDVDTRISTDTFFSDRAARPCGRFAAVAVLT
ncbi:MAG: peptidoglycan editing factor PgeF [Nocardioidaceae bacterium]|nr:peptidoglycan editing factor PgeF [Nocardioidaceae bacterium]